MGTPTWAPPPAAPVPPGPPILAGGLAAANRPRTGLIVGLICEALLILWLSFMAWGDNEGQPRLPFGEGVSNIVAVGVIPSFLVVAAALTLGMGGKAPSVIGAGFLLFVATVLGFFGGLLILLGRQDTGDH